jgi:hypothetical protein
VIRKDVPAMVLENDPVGIVAICGTLLPQQVGLSAQK